MIWVDRSQVPIPVELVGKASAGELELAAAMAFYGDPANLGESYEFSAYKSPGVIRALQALFHGKCAYCESQYLGTAPVDVEHFRPKGGVAVLEKGKVVLRKPGYYWLAAKWSNLLPSCIDCNRKRTQEFPGEDPAKTGKANHFPLKNDARRAMRSGEEARERPLLLNPCEDRPDEHLEFTEDGAVREALDRRQRPSVRGRVSIEVYGLRRTGLSQLRRDRAILVLAQIKRVKRLEQKLLRDPDDPELEAELAEEIGIFKEYMEDHQPYAGMARQLVRAFYRPGQP
jgi:uncharacterized protein (TIGR02646 family)